MSDTRRLETTVGAGGKIEVLAPDLPVGGTVEVTVRLTDNGVSDRRSVLDVLGECEGGILFKSVEDVDSYIRQERDSWDR